MQRLFAVSILALVLAAFFSPPSAFAHKVSYVTVAASFDTKERTFSVEMAMEVDPTEDAQLNAQISPEMAAGTFATEVLGLYFGDTEVSVEPVIELIEPKPEEIDVNFPDRRKVLVTLAGDVPEGADYFTLHLSEDNEATVIMVKIIDGKPGRRAEVLYPGEFSTPADIRTVIDGDPFEMAQTDAANPPGDASAEVDGTTPGSIDEATDSTSQPDEKTNADSADEGPSKSASPSWWQTLAAGFQQVLPQGFEILAALLAIFFFSPKGATLLRQSTAFVVALCSAVALSTLADVRPEVPHLAALAGLVVAVLALENLFHSRLRWWRLIGIALAGALFGLWLAPEIGIAPGMRIILATSTVSAHLAGLVLGIALTLVILHLAVGPLRNRPWYAKSVAFPASLIALGYAAFWMIDRW